jgi:hypothetical protein
MQQASDELVRRARQAELAIAIAKEVLVLLPVPEGDMHVAAVSGKVREGLGHEGGSQIVRFGQRLHHVFEECVAIGSGERVAIRPVHLELAVGVLVIILVRAPIESEHTVADLADQVVAAHQRLLVVARFALPVPAVADRAAVARQHEELALDARLHAVSQLGGALELAREHAPG